jgi:autotransporter-associated beta strand protein
MLSLNRSGSLLMQFVLIAGAVLSAAAALGQDIFVTNYLTSTVGEYTLSGSAVNASLFTTGPTAPFAGSKPQDLVVSGSDVFVVNQQYNTIGEYTTSGGTINPSLITGLNLPLAIAVSGSDLFVANLNLATIGEYTTSGATVNASLITGAQEVQGLAISGSDIFAATEFEDTIGEYTTSGGTINPSLVTGLNSPTGLVVSGSDIFVANYNSGTIGEYTTLGGTINAALITGLDAPVDLALSGSDLFVTNADSDTIGEYTTSGGTVNADLISGLNVPHGIAISPAPAPTPEPDTLALVGTVAACAAFYQWLRKKVSRAGSGWRPVLFRMAEGTTESLKMMIPHSQPRSGARVAMKSGTRQAWIAWAGGFRCFFASMLLALATAMADAAIPITTNLISFSANDIVADPVSGALYASTSAGLTTINPTAGTIGNSYALAGNPGTVVITNDDSYIYAVAGGGNTVERFNLSSHTNDLTFQMPGIGTQYPQDVRNIYTVPGQPSWVLIARYFPGYSPPAGGTYIYQNGVALPNSVGTGLGVGGPDIIAVDETGQHAFGYQNSVSSFSFYAMSLSGSGVNNVGGYASGYLSGYNIGRIAVAGGKLFDDQGQVYNLLSGANLGSFTGGGNFYLDAADNEFYSVTSNANSATLYAYNLTSLGLTGSSTITGINGSTSNLIRFGASGLAFNTPTQVVAVNSALVPFVWSASGGGNWNDGTRWSSGAFPNLSDEIANFGGSITQASTVTVTSPITAGSLYFSNSNSYTISGSAALTIQSNYGIAGFQEIMGSHSISVPIVLASPASITIGQTAATMTLSGPVSGTGSLTCSGSGTVVLANSNSFSGGIEFNSGALILAHALAAENSTVNVNSAAPLSFAAGNKNPILGGLAGAGSVTLTTAAGEPVTLSVGQNGQSTAFGGILSGSGSLVKQGSGTLTLAGPNSYNGATVISGGILRLSGFPAALSANLIYHLDPSSPVGLTLNGGSVAQLNDLTGHGNSFAASGASGPTLLTGAAGINGLSVIHFNGSQQLTLGNMTSPETIFIVDRVTSSGNLNGLWGQIGDFGIRETSGNSWQYASGNNNTYATPSTGSMYVNGVQVASNADGPFTPNATQVLDASDGTANGWSSSGLGEYGTGGAAGRYYTGDVGEVLAYSSTLTAATRQAVEAYLEYKWLGIGTPISVAGSNCLPAATALTLSAGSTVDLNGVNQQVASLTGSGLIMNGASGTPVVLTLSGSGSSTFGGMIQGGGTLGAIGLVVGRGTQLLTGSNTYTGPTTINSAQLVVDGSLASPATVNSGGTLGGTGNLMSVTVNSGGHLSPGDTLGKLTLSGSLGLAAGAALDFELDTPGTSDEVSMPGELLSLSGQQFSNFDFTETVNFAPGTYNLIAFGSSSGSLGANTSGTIDGLPARLSIQGNEVVLTVVPEPSTIVLIAAGSICLLGIAIRTRSASRGRFAEV